MVYAAESEVAFRAPGMVGWCNYVIGKWGCLRNGLGWGG